MGSFGHPRRTLRALWPQLSAGSPDAVHEVRKLTRRVQAQVRVARSPRATRRAWRDLRRAVAGVRDRDAAGAHLLQALQDLGVSDSERATFQAAWTADREARFAGVTLPPLPPAVKKPRHWKARTRTLLRRDARALIEEGDRVMDSRQVEDWHTWRRHLKRYRYTHALLDAPPNTLLRVLDDLGRMQDAHVIGQALATEAWLPEYRDALLEREEHARLAAEARVRRGWPALRRRLAAQAS